MFLGIPPGLLMIVGALLIPAFPGRLRQVYMLALPLVGLWALAHTADGIYYAHTFFSYELTHVRIDPLSSIFGYIFYIAAALCVIYAWHSRDTVEQIAMPARP